MEKTLLNAIMVNGKIISLAEMYLDFNKIRVNWEKIEKLKNIQFLPHLDRTKLTRDQDSILGSIYQNLIYNHLIVVQKDKKMTITTVEVESTDELVKEVSNFYVDIESKKARLNQNILEKQTDSVRNELNKSISGESSMVDDNIFNLNTVLNVRKVPSVRHQVKVKGIVLGGLLGGFLIVCFLIVRKTW